jgi:hypothetical protein
MLWEGRKKIGEEDLEKALEAAGGSAAAAKDSKPGTGKPKPGGKGAPVEEEVVEKPADPNALDFSKPVDYKLAPGEYEANTSTQ